MVEKHEEQLVAVEVCQALAHEIDNAREHSWLELQRLVANDPAADLQSRVLGQSVAIDRTHRIQKMKELIQTALETGWSEMDAK